MLCQKSYLEECMILWRSFARMLLSDLRCGLFLAAVTGAIWLILLLPWESRQAFWWTRAGNTNTSRWELSPHNLQGEISPNHSSYLIDAVYPTRISEKANAESGRTCGSVGVSASENARNKMMQYRRIGLRRHPLLHVDFLQGLPDSSGFDLSTGISIKLRERRHGLDLKLWTCGPSFQLCSVQWRNDNRFPLKSISQP